MSAAHRESGFTFRIWPNDHEPPHVHAWKGGDVVVIRIESLAVLKVRGMKDHEVVRAVRIVAANDEKLMKEWRQIHGEE